MFARLVKVKSKKVYVRADYGFLFGVVVKLRIRQISKEEPIFVEVAGTNEIEPGKMKSVDVKGKHILIANVDGKYYAMDDR